MLAGGGRQSSPNSQPGQSQLSSTSPSDGIEGSVETLRGMALAANWQEGRHFGESLNETAVTEWVNGFDLETNQTTEETAVPEDAVNQ